MSITGPRYRDRYAGRRAARHRGGPHREPGTAESAAPPDRAILGCTHYEIIAGLFHEALPVGTPLIHQPDATAAAIADLPGPPSRNMIRDRAVLRRFLTTGHAGPQNGLVQRFWGSAPLLRSRLNCVNPPHRPFMGTAGICLIFSISVSFSTISLYIPFMLPTLRQLQYLKLLSEHGSFSRAAEAAHVTQPTLSAGIQELEKILGRPMVDRNRSGVILTAAGAEAVMRAVRDSGPGRGSRAGLSRRRTTADRPVPAGRDPDDSAVHAAGGAADPCGRGSRSCACFCAKISPTA